MLKRTKKMNFYFLIWTFYMFSEISLKLEETFPSWLTFIFNPYGLTDNKSSAIISSFYKISL